jgi:hypothetical protein
MEQFRGPARFYIEYIRRKNVIELNRQCPRALEALAFGTAA